MAGMRSSKVIRGTKGKVILALFLACAALLLAWGVSKVAFREMLETVENMSSPNERLRIVNELSRKISRLDQNQKKLAFTDPGKYNSFFKESRQLRKALDSLGTLYQGDSVQLSRIASIKKLLVVRDRQLVDYLKVRERLVNDESFSSQLDRFSDMVNKSAADADSTVVASERRTTTTTVVPAEKPRSFFGKLFGGKKKSESDEQSYRITNEENVTRDTIALSTEGKMVKGVEQTLRNLQRAQQQKSRSFIAREAVLAEANNLLINEMLDIIKKVEQEAVEEIEQNNLQAKQVVNTGIQQMTLIMVVFFLLMVLLLFLILTDITRSNRYRKELEAATEEAEYHGRAKQRFLSNMSHEIRTPLQSIIGYAEMIRNQQNPNRRDIDAIYHSSEHLLQIVNEVLDYNRLVSGKFSFATEVFNIRRLLEEVALIVKPQAEKKALRLRTAFELENLWYIAGDPFRLKQILFNLLSNAIKFTQQGEVVFEAFFKRQGDALHFTFRVQDTGIGLTEQECASIFNEFEQTDDPEKTVLHQAGAGLGLSIVKSLVEQQGGRIYVKSKKGVGSNFTFFLTFKVAEKPAAVLPGADQAVSSLTGKVWVVDDDQLILDLCSLIFDKHALHYTCFNAPEDLLAADWDPAVEYVLMDIRMPKMTGPELCRALRAAHGHSVKLLAMTAQVLPEEQEALLAQGFDGLINKPFREVDLMAALGRTLEGANALALYDPAYLEKMTFGDQEQYEKILNRFVQDCQDDEASLQQYMAIGNYDKASLLLHRLAGRLSQMGSRELAMAFRSMEINVNASLEEDDALPEEQVQGIQDLCARLRYSISYRSILE